MPASTSATTSRRDYIASPATPPRSFAAEPRVPSSYIGAPRRDPLGVWPVWPTHPLLDLHDHADHDQHIPVLGTPRPRSSSSSTPTSSPLAAGFSSSSWSSSPPLSSPPSSPSSSLSSPAPSPSSSSPSSAAVPHPFGSVGSGAGTGWWRALPDECYWVTADDESFCAPGREVDYVPPWLADTLFLVAAQSVAGAVADVLYEVFRQRVAFIVPKLNRPAGSTDLPENFFAFDFQRDGKLFSRIVGRPRLAPLLRPSSSSFSSASPSPQPRRTPSAATPADDDGDGLRVSSSSSAATPTSDAWTRPTLPGALDWDWGVQHPTSQAQPQAPRTTTTTTPPAAEATTVGTTRTSWTRPVRPGSLDWDWDAQGPAQSQSQSHSQPHTQPQPHVTSSPAADADAAPITMMPMPSQPWISSGQQQRQPPGTGTTSTSTAAAGGDAVGVGISVPGVGWFPFGLPPSAPTINPPKPPQQAPRPELVQPAAAGVGVSVPGVGWFPFGVPPSQPAALLPAVNPPKPPQQQPPRPARPVQPAAAAVGVGVSVPGVGWFPFGLPPSQPAALLPAINPPTPPQQQPPRPEPVQPAWLLRLIAQQRDAKMADSVDTAAAAPVSPATWRPSSSLWPNIPPHQPQQQPAAVWIPRLFRWNRGIAAAIMRGDNNSNTPMCDHVATYFTRSAKLLSPSCVVSSLVPESAAAGRKLLT
ncbi:hypothetical protein Pelo_7097 [Pelomyxa schiedti]|nr:hypothetical protein Pelo_7097 [Pelomyxa schiedti]